MVSGRGVPSGWFWLVADSVGLFCFCFVALVQLWEATWGDCYACVVAGVPCVRQAGKRCKRCQPHGQPCDVDGRGKLFPGPLWLSWGSSADRRFSFFLW